MEAGVRVPGERRLPTSDGGHVCAFETSLGKGSKGEETVMARELKKARTMGLEGKWEEALVELNKVLQKDAKNVEALKERAKVHIRLKQVVEAEFDIKEGHRLKPDSPEFDILQAHVCRLEGDFERGVELMDTLIAKNGETVASLVERGHCYRLSMNYQKSLDDYTSALEKDSRNAEAYAGRATTYWLGNLEACIADCEQALAIEPTNGQALYSIGEAYRISGQPEKAISFFTRAIESNKVNRMDPVDLYACRGLCLQHVDADRNEEAIADLEEAFVGRPERQQQALWQFKACHFLGNAAYDSGLKEHYYTD